MKQFNFLTVLFLLSMTTAAYCSSFTTAQKPDDMQVPVYYTGNDERVAPGVFSPKDAVEIDGIYYTQEAAASVRSEAGTSQHSRAEAASQPNKARAYFTGNDEPVAAGTFTLEQKTE
jgi:hypothetical protein